MSGKGWIVAIAIVAGLVTVFILTGHFEQWTDSDIRDLWWPAFALLVIGFLVWFFGRTPNKPSGGKR